MNIAMKIHSLKIIKEYFILILSGKKTFEIRKDDRGYEVGDLLRLNEWLYEKKTYTGRHTLKQVLYISDYAQRDGYVVMSLGDVEDPRGEQP